MGQATSLAQPAARKRAPNVPADERARKPAAAFTKQQPPYGEADTIIDLKRAYYASLTLMDV